MINLGYRYARSGKAGNRNYIYFYVINPETNKEERIRIYIDKIKPKTNRDRYSRRLISEINDKLDHGWNPLIEKAENKKKYSTINDALNFVLDYKLRFVRNTTIKGYIQRIEALKEWLSGNVKLDEYIYKFSGSMAQDFMNDLFSNSQISPRTFNNYLIDYRTFFNLLKDHKYLNENPFRSVKKLPEVEPLSRPFTESEQTIYKEYLLKNDIDFYIISQYCYYCALRPKEICELKILNINLDKGLIKVPASISKNRKNRLIPIAYQFLETLRGYLNDYPEDYYICSNKCKPGEKKVIPIRIAERFREIANKLKLPKELKFYNLKDTTAERLLSAGFNTKVIRDLFGHSNIAITDSYLKKFNLSIDERLMNDFPEF